jgi:hypothetical protein
MSKKVDLLAKLRSHKKKITLIQALRNKALHKDGMMKTLLLQPGKIPRARRCLQINKAAL